MSHLNTIIKYQTNYSYSLLELSRIFSEVVFERISLIDLLFCNLYNVSKGFALEGSSPKG